MELATSFPTHDLVWVTGDDSVTFLDGLITQNVDRLEPGTVARSFLLAPNGKLRALLWLLREGDAVGLISDHGGGNTIIGDLTRFKLRVDVEMAAPVPLFTVLDPEPAPEQGTWSRTDEHVAVAVAGRVLATAVPAEAAELTLEALDEFRIEAGEPVMGVDVDESTIPQETGLVPDAVDFTKGCYLGQELVARIDSRGHVNRRLSTVRLNDPAATPEPGAEVVSNDADVGRLTTVVAGAGMGLVRREVAAGDRVEVRWGDSSTEGRVSLLGEFASR